MFGTISFYLPSLAFFLNICLVIASNFFYFDSMNTLWLLLLLLFLLLLLLLLLLLYYYYHYHYHYHHHHHHHHHQFS